MDRVQVTATVTLSQWLHYAEYNGHPRRTFLFLGFLFGIFLGSVCAFMRLYWHAAGIFVLIMLVFLLLYSVHRRSWRQFYKENSESFANREFCFTPQGIDFTDSAGSSHCALQDLQNFNETSRLLLFYLTPAESNETVAVPAVPVLLYFLPFAVAAPQLMSLNREVTLIVGLSLLFPVVIGANRLHTANPQRSFFTFFIGCCVFILVLLILLGLALSGIENWAQS